MIKAIPWQIGIASSRMSSLLSRTLPYRGISRTGGELGSTFYLIGRKVSTESNANILIITDRCVSQMKEIATRNECLRVAVEGGGCSGFEYKMSLDSEVHNEDKIFEKDGVKVIVDETSLELLKGATVDYSDELIRSAFRVTKNPIAEKGCSCGTSFAVKMD